MIVTGATSMIGVALINECIAENVKVYAVVRPGSLNLNRLPCSKLIQVVECDLESLMEFEDLIPEECDRESMICIWVRIFSVYGENDKKTSMISQSIRKILNREETSFTACEQIWDYLYSSDAGKAMYLIGENSL